MLIINADDLGGTRKATAAALACYREGLITSATAMVYMADSRDAARQAVEAGLTTGLHLNLTRIFDSPETPGPLADRIRRVASYFRRGPWTMAVYHPFLKDKIDYLFKAQYAEYVRSFGREPSHIDGHHHAHLCLNVILAGILPPGLRVRRNFTFAPGEKGFLNRFYRRLVDGRLLRDHRSTDSFYGIESARDHPRLVRIVRAARTSPVELMVHPERTETSEYLWSPAYRELIASVARGTYRMLP